MKIAFLSIAIGLLIFTVSSGPPTSVGADHETLRARTDELVRPYLDNHMIVGMTIGVLHEGKGQVFGYGRMSRDDRRVPDGDTIYELGSTTKVMTGILLADAVVRGQVKLDQPAGQLLPAGVKMPAKGDRAITLQDLATHASGLPRIPDNMRFADPNNPYADYREEDLYAFLNNHKLARPPGKQYAYSNLGAGLLGHLLSRQAKSTYEELLRNRIAVPLKLSSTKITIDKKSQSRFAPGHTSDGQPAARWDDVVLAGAGSVCTTVNDMLLFAAANLAPPQDKLGEAIEMAWTIHQKPITKGDPSLGLGWHVTPDGTHWHNGQTGGYHAMMLINRKFNSSVILLTNTSTEEVDRLSADIFRMIVGAKVAPRKFETANDGLADASQKNEKTVDVSAEALRKFVGRYELAPGIVFTVTTKNGKLLVGLTGQPSYEVFPRSETAFFYKVVDATITFHVNKNGKCDSLVLFQDGNKQTAKRKKGPADALHKNDKTIDVPAEALKQFVGRYELAPGIVFTVTTKNGKLMVGLTGQPSVQVFARSETVWFPKAFDATITFHIDKSGECKSLELFQGGTKQTATRVK